MNSIDETFARVTRLTHSAVQALKVRSALNPMLWLTGMVLLPLLFAAWVFRDYATICVALICLGALPIVVTCVGFAGFAIRRPELLQSEEYQLQRLALTAVIEKGGVLPLDEAALAGVFNPQLSLQANNPPPNEPA